MNQTLHIFQPALAYSEKCSRTHSLPTINLLEETLSHIMSWSLAQSQDEKRPVSQCPSRDWRDKPAPTARLAVNLPSQQDSKLESRNEVGKIGQLPVELTVVDENRSTLLEISTIEARHRVNDQQGWSLRQESLQALRYPNLFSKVFWLKHNNVLRKLSPSIQ